MKIDSPLTYKDAGVDIAAGNQLVSDIKKIAQKTFRPGVVGGIGGFGALFEIPFNQYQHPVLVSSTDGVGTKLMLAKMLNQHDTIGIDLVAMCVNDIIVQGAEPLFFLDYFATGKLDSDIAQRVIAGIGRGCEMANVALVGGETAEMPGMYQENDYDLAGFTVGIVEKDKIITGQQVQCGDVILGLGASGPHANGYSLIRKILAKEGNCFDKVIDAANGATLGEILITPTKIYVNTVLTLMKTITPHAIAHITGGGLIENIPRVLPDFTQGVINKQAWEIPTIFKWLQAKGNISDYEMYRTFNCGIGLVLCIPEHNAKQAIELLTELNEPVWQVGIVEKSQQKEPLVKFI